MIGTRALFYLLGSIYLLMGAMLSHIALLRLSMADIRMCAEESVELYMLRYGSLLYSYI